MSSGFLIDDEEDQVSDSEMEAKIQNGNQLHC